MRYWEVLTDDELNECDDMLSLFSYGFEEQGLILEAIKKDPSLDPDLARVLRLAKASRECKLKGTNVTRMSDEEFDAFIKRNGRPVIWLRKKSMKPKNLGESDIINLDAYRKKTIPIQKKSSGINIPIKRDLGPPEGTVPTLEPKPSDFSHDFKRIKEPEFEMITPLKTEPTLKRIGFQTKDFVPPIPSDFPAQTQLEFNPVNDRFLLVIFLPRQEKSKEELVRLNWIVMTTVANIRTKLGNFIEYIRIEKNSKADFYNIQFGMSRKWSTFVELEMLKSKR